MITCYLQGGIGNRLYQIAATIGHANQIDTEWYIPLFDEMKYFPNLEYGRISGLPQYREPAFHYSDIGNRNDIELFGYFQSERYFEHCKDEIVSRLTPDCESIKIADKTCSVHVRRGDYLKLSEYHYNLPISWQISAMNQMMDYHFVVFSDDIAYCKKKMVNFDNITFMDTGNHIEDLYQMSRCDFHIIANSTFSVWASILSGKPVIAPPKHKWFGEKKKGLSLDDLYSDKWLIW